MRYKKIFLLMLLALWSLGTATGIYVLGRYEFTAGEAVNDISEWPESLTMPFVAGRMNLVVMAHPHCPCSKASLEELNNALAAVPLQPYVRLVYYRPPGVTAAWSQSELVAESRRLSGIAVIFDEDGKIAETLGARTSFDVFLFNASRQIIFRGGITRGRGIYGANPGRRALEAALRGETAAKMYPVYGCPLRNNPKNFPGKV
ncbi:MAG: hypothetical protein KF713_07855 [Turneriella sp.]|nr:hypothetical protein [Turneriella sp.]